MKEDDNLKEKNNIKEDLLKTENLYQLKVGDMIVDMVYSDNNKNKYFGIYRSLINMKKMLTDYQLSHQVIDIYPSEMNNYGNTHEYAIICQKVKK